MDELHYLQFENFGWIVEHELFHDIFPIFAFLSHGVDKRRFVVGELDAVEGAHGDEHVGHLLLFESEALKHFFLVDPLEGAVFDVNAGHDLAELDSFCRLIPVRVVVDKLAAWRRQQEAKDRAGARVDNIIIEEINNLRGAAVRRHDVLGATLTRCVDELSHEASRSIQAQYLLEKLLVAPAYCLPKLDRFLQDIVLLLADQFRQEAVDHDQQLDLVFLAELPYELHERVLDACVKRAATFLYELPRIGILAQKRQQDIGIDSKLQALQHVERLFVDNLSACRLLLGLFLLPCDLLQLCYDFFFKIQIHFYYKIG